MVSSSWVWTDVGSLLNRAGGDGQGRAKESLTGPTRKVPVTMGAVRGSAVWKAVLEAAWDLSGCPEGPSWGGSALGAEQIALLAVGGNSRLLLSPGQSWFDQQLLCAQQPGPCPQPSPEPGPLELPEMETRDGPIEPLRQDRPVHRLLAQSSQGAPSTSQRGVVVPPSDWGRGVMGRSKRVRDLLPPFDWELPEDRDCFSIILGSSWSGPLPP